MVRGSTSLVTELELEAQAPPPRVPTPHQAVLGVGWRGTLGLALVATAYLLAPRVDIPAGTIQPAVYLCSALFVAGLVAWQLALLPLAWLRVRAQLVVAFTLLGASFVLAAAGWGLPADLMLILGGAAGGFLLATLIDRPWWLVPAGVCIAAADSWSVFAPQGVSRQVLERAPEAVGYLTVEVPVVGLDGALVLGVVDVAFIAMYVAIARWWGFSLLLTGVALAAALPLTVWLSFEVLAGRPVPALPAFALAFVVANVHPLWKDWKRDSG